MVYGWDLGIGTFAIFSVLFAVVLPRVNYLQNLGVYGTLLLCVLGTLLVIGFSYFMGYAKPGKKSKSRPRQEAEQPEEIVYERAPENDREDAIEVGYSSDEED